MIRNINKPTAPKWNRVAVACSAASSFIAGYGLISSVQAWIWIGGTFGVLGTIIPILMPEEK